ncbi:MAG: hypothetical protein DRP99_02445 [Candidatus Latescibacterota bacterium]|nr:MAG: hypothetical protein DRP99_02445 [Candidatus Latescibacterota bacterium]
MIGIIAKREFMRNLLNLRFPSSALLCVILTTTVVYLRSEGYEEELRNYRTTIELQEERLKYTTLNWAPFAIYKPPSKLSVFFRGCPWKEEYDWIALGGLTPRGDPFRFLFAGVDLGWVIGAVMGLLAIIFAHDAFTSEREGGTLKLMLSNPIPRHSVIVGKWIGGYGSLAAVLVISLLSGVIVAELRSIRMEGADWIALGMVALASLLVISAFFWLAVLVSVRARTSFSSLLISLGIWVASVLLIPNLSPDLAGILVKAPSIEVLKRREGAIVKKYRGQWLKKLQEYKAEIRKYREERDIEGINRVCKELLLASLKKDGPFRRGQLRMDEELGKLRTDFNNRIRKGVRTSMAFSSLSPFASFIYAVNTLSGTGIRSQLVFSESAEEFVVKFREWFLRQSDKAAEMVERMAPSEIPDDFIERPLDVADMPRFSFREDIGGRVASSLVYILVLALYNVMFFMAAHLSFLRCPIA